jgi:hypothetical protein
VGKFDHVAGVLSSLLIQLSRMSLPLPLSEQVGQSICERFLWGMSLLDEGKWKVELQSQREVYLSLTYYLSQTDFTLLKGKTFGSGLIDIQKLFADLKAVDKTTSSGSLSDEPQSRKASNSDAHSITTLLANVQGEFKRREQAKKALFTKWIEEGTVSESVTLLIVQIT